MGKIGRNEPCPCGSGKKYKKCHGASRVVELSPDRYNLELKQLHERLIEFATFENGAELQTLMQRYPEATVMDDEKLLDIYLTGLTSWGIFHEPVYKQQTLFDLFYKKQKHNIKRERVRKTFESWREVLPSIYEVRSITGDTTYLQDVRTGKEYQVLHDEEYDFEEGSIIVGILVPYVQYYDLFSSVFELTEGKEELIDIITSVSDEDLKENYPQILGEMLQAEYVPEKLEWMLPIYAEVADLLVGHMERKNAPDGIVASGVALWMAFTQKELPDVRKPGAYAAAVEYIVQQAIGDQFQSQKDLAKEYGTSPGTVSKLSRKMTETLDIEIDFIVSEMLDIAADAKSSTSSASMEQTMRDLEHILGEQTFESEEELQQFLAGLHESQQLPMPHSMSNQDLAQDKLFDAYRAKGSRRKKLIKEALDLYPNNPDAYLLLAEDAKSMQEAYQLYHQAVVAGEKDLGEEFFKENKGYFWLMTETRPYMRAKSALADAQHALGDSGAAIATYESMLELNPNDNQGIRYVLLTLYLEVEQYKKAEALLEKYIDDATAHFYFNNALLHFFRDGLTAKAKALLRKANNRNVHVKDYLTGKKAVPRKQPDYFGIGDDLEAIDYVQANRHLWEKASPLIEELEALY